LRVHPEFTLKERTPFLFFLAPSPLPSPSRGEDEGEGEKRGKSNGVAVGFIRQKV